MRANCLSNFCVFYRGGVYLYETQEKIFLFGFISWSSLLCYFLSGREKFVSVYYDYFCLFYWINLFLSICTWNKFSKQLPHSNHFATYLNKRNIRYCPYFFSLACCFLFPVSFLLSFISCTYFF